MLYAASSMFCLRSGKPGAAPGSIGAAGALGASPNGSMLPNGGTFPLRRLLPL